MMLTKQVGRTNPATVRKSIPANSRSNLAIKSQAQAIAMPITPAQRLNNFYELFKPAPKPSLNTGFRGPSFRAPNQ